MGGVVLLCGPFIALSYWRLLMESYYVHDKIKLYLKNVVESRLNELVGNGFCSWQGHCSNGKGVSGNQKDAVTRIMLGGAPIVFVVATLLHGLRVGLLTSLCMLCHVWQFWVIVGVYVVVGILWLVMAVRSFRSMNGKYCNLGKGDWQIHFWPSKGKTS